MAFKAQACVSAYCLAILTLLGVGTTSAGYLITDLGPAAAGSTGIANGLNAQGTVVGKVSQGSYSTAEMATSGGVFTPVPLAALGSIGSSAATAINDSGQIAGSFHNNGDNTDHAFLATNGVATDLGRFSYQPSQGPAVLALSSVPTALNSLGQIAGTSRLADGTYQAFVGGSSGISFLTAMGDGRYTQANGINSVSVGLAQVVGTFEKGTGIDHAFYTDTTGKEIDLTSKYSLSGFGVNSYGMAINSTGAVAGYGDFGLNSSHAFLATGAPGTGKTPVIDLGVLDGYTSSKAFGLNATDQVVGALDVRNADSTAFVWDPTAGMIDLRTLIPKPDQLSWTSLSVATAINDNLQITGQGIYNGQVHAFELTPIGGQAAFVPAGTVPAPPALALSALGMAIAAAWGRRRRA